MTTVSILGKGDMGPAIASIVEKVGHTVELFRSSTPTNPQPASSRCPIPP